MHGLINWIEHLLEDGLDHYLSTKKALTSTPRPKQLLSVVEELSNLCIRPWTIQNLFLLEVCCHITCVGWVSSANLLSG
jgi:hypothetical protein